MLHGVHPKCCVDHARDMTFRLAQASSSAVDIQDGAEPTLIPPDQPTKLCRCRDAADTRAAERAGISLRYVQRLAQDGKIKGAVLIGRDWLIPPTFKWKPLTRGPKPKEK